MPWYGYLIIAVAIVVVIIAFLLTGNIKKLKEWLIYAVAAAEKELGSGTGQLKLREVYDKFIDRFPILAKFIPFTTFSNFVDEALETLDKWLENNVAIQKYVDKN